MNIEMKILGEKENFLGLQSSFSSLHEAAFVIVPAPLERSTSFGKGTKHGPKKILQASHQVEFFDEELYEEPFRRGIATIASLDFNRISVEKCVNRIADAVSNLNSMGKFPIVIGGEHTITIGAVQGSRKSIDSFSVLHLDAHSDLRDDYEGNPYSHASAMKRVWEINPSIVLCGIRSQCREEAEFIAEREIPVFYAHQLHRFDSWEPVIDRLGKNVYVTIDCDFFDPSIMPAVGTPEPNGFLWSETLQFLSLLCRTRTIIGFDVVELAPAPSLFLADFTVARLIYKFLGYIGKERKQEFPMIF